MALRPRWPFHVLWLIETAGGKINDIDAGWKATFDGSLSLIVKTPLNLLQHKIDVNHIFLWDSWTSYNSYHIVSTNIWPHNLKLSWRISNEEWEIIHTINKLVHLWHIFFVKVKESYSSNVWPWKCDWIVQ